MPSSSCTRVACCSSGSVPDLLRQTKTETIRDAFRAITGTNAGEGE